MKNNLVAEVRTDKNGVQVKRYVRADYKGAGKQRRLPSPAPDVDEQKLRLSRKLSLLVSEVLIEGSYEDVEIDIPDDLPSYLAKTFSTETIEAYVRASEGEPEGQYPDLLLGVLSNRDSDKVAQYALAIAKIDDQKDGEWADWAKGNYTYVSSLQIYYGMHDPEYEFNVGYVPPESIHDESDPEVTRVMGLIRLTNELYSKDEYGTSLIRDEGGRAEVVRVDDNNMVQLVLDRPDDALEIASMIIDQDIRNVDVIQARLDAPVQTLRDGAL